MPTGGRSTLAQFLIESRRTAPDAAGDFDALVTEVALACKAIARHVAYGALSRGTLTSGAGAPNTALPAPHAAADAQHTLDITANDILLRATEWGGHVAGIVSEELEDVYLPSAEYPRGKYLLLCDPLDGSSNVDVNMSVGSIFSILRAPDTTRDATRDDFLQPGTSQVCAGYAVYGPSTMLVLSLGQGTHAFTLEPELGEWVLSHHHLRIPAQTREFAINASNARFWAPAVKRYVDECLAGGSGPRGVDFNMRWIASLVAEAHRILMRGGVFLYPRDARDSTKTGRLRLLYEVNPIGFLIEQAGGRASTGHSRSMDVMPASLHQRVGFVFGSSDEVARIEQYHQDEPQDEYASPLFGKRGLYMGPDGGTN